MKLYFEDDNGNKIEIKRAVGLQEGDVILFAPAVMRKEDLEKMEIELSGKMNRKVIILDGHFSDIVTLPPVEDQGEEIWKTDSPD